LEDRLGVKLLVRSPRGLAPTEAGFNFYERVRRSIEEAELVAVDASGEPFEFAGLVVIPPVQLETSSGTSLPVSRSKVVPRGAGANIAKLGIILRAA
jgi:DNA-binding transcriptional LysR family regulator